MENAFLKEIKEQPHAFKCCMDTLKSEECKNSIGNIIELIKRRNIEKIVFTGMGSSYFVSRAISSILASDGMSAFTINAAELLHCQYPILDKKVLLVCISQSGESFEVVQLLKNISPEIPVVGITNVSDSSLAKRSNYVLYSMAGIELMTSTKTFITTYLVAYVLAKSITAKRINWNIIDRLDVEIGDIINSGGYDEIANFLNRTDFIQVIARGTDFAAASQTALMFMEATKTSASAMLGGEFRHGPLEMVNDKFVCIVFAHSASSTYSQMLHLVNDILGFGGRVLLVTNQKVESSNKNLLQLMARCDDSELFVIPSIIPTQLLVNFYAEKKNIIPGGFAHGAKVTSIE